MATQSQGDNLEASRRPVELVESLSKGAETEKSWTASIWSGQTGWQDEKKNHFSQQPHCKIKIQRNIKQVFLNFSYQTYSFNRWETTEAVTRKIPKNLRAGWMINIIYRITKSVKLILIQINMFLFLLPQGSFQVPVRKLTDGIHIYRLLFLIM